MMVAASGAEAQYRDVARTGRSTPPTVATPLMLSQARPSLFGPSPADARDRHAQIRRSLGQSFAGRASHKERTARSRTVLSSSVINPLRAHLFAPN